MSDYRTESDSLGVVEVPAGSSGALRARQRFDASRDDHGLRHVEESRRRESNRQTARRSALQIDRPDFKLLLLLLLMMMMMMPHRFLG
jgi:hypothetical protein